MAPGHSRGTSDMIYHSSWVRIALFLRCPIEDINISSLHDEGDGFCYQWLNIQRSSYSFKDKCYSNHLYRRGKTVGPCKSISRAHPVRFLQSSHDTNCRTSTLAPSVRKEAKFYGYLLKNSSAYYKASPTILCGMIQKNPWQPI